MTHLKDLIISACTYTTHAYSKLRDLTFQYIRRLPIWAGLALLFTAYFCFVAVCLPAFALIIFGIVTNQISTGWNALLELYQYQVLYDLAYACYKAYTEFSRVNAMDPPMSLGWQLNFLMRLLYEQRHVLLTLHVVMLCHSIVLTHFQFWASSIINKEKAPVRKRFSIQQFLIDWVLFAFLIISFAFFGGGGASAAIFIWGLATVGNIFSFSAIIQWIANHTRREAITLFWAGLILKTCIWLSPELVNFALLWSSGMQVLQELVQLLPCWDSVWKFIESCIRHYIFVHFWWIPDFSLNVWPWGNNNPPASPRGQCDQTAFKKLAEPGLTSDQRKAIEQEHVFCKQKAKEYTNSLSEYKKFSVKKGDLEASVEFGTKK